MLSNYPEVSWLNIRTTTTMGKPKNVRRPRLSEEEYECWKKYREEHKSLKGYCEENGIPMDSVTQYWHKGQHFSVMAKTAGATSSEYEDALQRVVDRLEHRPHVAYKKKPSCDKALKVTITDEHVGMDAQPGSSIFSYHYGAEEYKASMDKVFDAVMKEFHTHGRFDLLMIDSLGDQQDGYNGRTTRGGHELPQNMGNGEMFETCLEARLTLVERIVDEGVCNRMILRSVSSDNHSGDFGLIVNKALKMLVNKIYNNNIVDVEILERFMEHRIYGDHCFILTHGKDAVHMTRGLPLHLTDRARAFIQDYIDHHNITSKYIHVEKGDLHQLGYERTKRFDYRNFGSFAPPSAWVQHNFGDSYSCFSVQVVPKFSSEISHTDYFLDYRKYEKNDYENNTRDGKPLGRVKRSTCTKATSS